MTVGSIAEPTVTASPQLDAPVAPVCLCSATGCGLGAHPAGPPKHRSVVDPAAVRTAQTSPPPSRRLRRRGRLDAGLAAGSARRHLAGPVAGQRRGCRRAVLAPHPVGVAGWPRTRPVMDARLVLPSVIHRLRRRPHPPLAELACCSAIPARQPDQHHGAAAATPKAFTQMQALCSAEPDVSRSRGHPHHLPSLADTGGQGRRHRRYHHRRPARTPRR